MQLTTTSGSTSRAPRVSGLAGARASVVGRRGVPLRLAGLALACLALGSACAQTGAAERGAGAANELGRADGRYGAAVAWSGDVAVVGALGAGDDFAGAAYVYERQGGAWHMTAQLTSGASAPRAFFGGSVAVSGSDVAVGAWGADLVEVYSRTANGWTLSAELRPSEQPGEGGSHFGCDLALSGDVLAVAAAHAGNEPTRAGAVHLYARERGAWRETAVLTPIGLTSGALFGSSLALSGGVLAVGAMHDRAGPAGSGAVYLYRLTAGGAQLAQRVAAPLGANARYFGSSVALLGDVLAVSAPGGDYGDYRSGPVFLYRHEGSTWEYFAQVGPSGGPDQLFGVDVALTKGGVAVAVATDNGAASGTVRVLLYPLTTSAAPRVLFESEAPQVRYVALAADGEGLLVGLTTGERGRGAVFALAGQEGEP